ncbi:MAG TPA: hypothetical protein VF322_03505 [Gammaproteobacteria bacterium]
MDERQSPAAGRQRPRGASATPATLALALMALAQAGLPPHAAAQEGEEPASTEVRNCIDLRSIDHTRVVDDDTLLFYMRGGGIYRNDLPNRCPQLASEERFMYRVALNQLCDIDVITVLTDLGFGFMPAASCALGKFQPISDDLAERLLSQSD